MLDSTLLLPTHNAKTVWDRGKQYFVDTKGDRVPSVTTILSATKPQEDGDALTRWKQRVGVAEASQITKAALQLTAYLGAVNNSGSFGITW